MSVIESNSGNENSRRFASMTAEKKLNLSMKLYYSARELKRAWLRLQHPGWEGEEIEQELRRIFTHAGT